MARRRGRRGAGSITRRDGRYQARWSSTEGGKRVRKSATFDLRSDAEWWLRQAGRGAVPEALSVGDYLERWLAGKRSIAPSTRAQYRNHVELHIVPALGRFALIALQPKHIEAFVSERERHVSESTHRPLTARTIQAILTTLRSALEDAVPRLILDNPAAKVEAPRVTREPVRDVGAVEAGRVIAAVRGTWIESIVRFLFGSGLRIGEALSIDQGMIDWKSGEVRIGKSKTNLRTLPVSDDALDALRLAIRQAPRVGPKEPVFFGQRATSNGARERLNRASVDHALPRILEAAAVERLTPHGLRHGHATVALEGGTPIEVIAKQLGHKRPSLTQNIYAHVTRRHQRAALSVIDEAVKR
jgi:integrase